MNFLVWLIGWFSQRFHEDGAEEISLAEGWSDQLRTFVVSWACGLWTSGFHGWFLAD